MTVVYLITCLPTGRKYIGITEDMAARWRSHVSQALNPRIKSRGLLRHAIRHYGREAFTIVTIYEAASRVEARMVERGLIAAYGTYQPRGMNMTSGGEGGDDLERIRERRKRPAVQSEETRERIRQARLGVLNTEACKAKMREARLKWWKQKWEKSPRRSPERRRSGYEGIVGAAASPNWSVHVTANGQRYFAVGTESLAETIVIRDALRAKVGWVGRKMAKPKAKRRRSRFGDADPMERRALHTAALKAAWADPVKRAERIAKNREARDRRAVQNTDPPNDI